MRPARNLKEVGMEWSEEVLKFHQAVRLAQRNYTQPVEVAPGCWLYSGDDASKEVEVDTLSWWLKEDGVWEKHVE